jgi:hypothetical protein
MFFNDRNTISYI